MEWSGEQRRRVFECCAGNSGVWKLAASSSLKVWQRAERRGLIAHHSSGCSSDMQARLRQGSNVRGRQIDLSQPRQMQKHSEQESTKHSKQHEQGDTKTRYKVASGSAADRVQFCKQTSENEELKIFELGLAFAAAHMQVNRCINMSDS